MAGNRVGKTVAAGTELTYHLTGCYPHWWRGRRFKRATLQKVETMHSALQAAQIVATEPGVTPAAGEIAKSAGLRDENPGGIPAPSAMAAAVAASAPPVAPAEPTPPSVSDTAPGPLEGMQAGIETPTGADNVAPPVDPSVSNLPQEPMQ
jgi:hypothetical protein